MERTNPSESNQKLTVQQAIQLYSTLTARADLASRLGLQYGGDRDVYQALGYQETIQYSDYLSRFLRQDIAQAIITRPVRVTWQGGLNIAENDLDADVDPIEVAWRELDDRLGLKSRFSRVDKLTGIGEYGILLLGLDDTRNKEDFKEEVKPGDHQLRYVKPYGQGSAKIIQYESLSSSPRYGMPKLYEIQVSGQVSDLGGGIMTTIQVHHTRIIHITDEPLESEVRGLPRLQVVYNRLFDLEKLVGGDAEMFWLGARPGFTGEVDKDFQMTPTAKENLEDQFDEYEHKLRRFLINEGVNIKTLEQQIASQPQDHVDIQIQMISAVTGIPKRILTGSERGELSSGQDKGEWLNYVQSRRDEHADPRIVRPFVDRCIELGILPDPGDTGYSVVWEDLFSVSDKDKAEVGKIRANALQLYSQNPMAEIIIPPEAFMKLLLGLSDEEITEIENMRETAQALERPVTEEEENIIEEETE